MPRISKVARFWIALALWMAGIGFFVFLTLWSYHSSRENTENRLITEAGRVASQLAAILSVSGWELDIDSARAITAGAMEDERIYAVKIQTPRGMLDGQRRNYLWEPVPFDDEIAENCIQGINPIKIRGQSAGTIEIWLSPRLYNEEETQLLDRERTRFFLSAAVWSVAFLILFLYWGGFRQLYGRYPIKKSSLPGEAGAAQLPAPGKITDAKESGQSGDAVHRSPCDIVLGRSYMRKHPESWFITSALFARVFARAPELMAKLYAEGEIAGLCHLGHILEQTAPCLGAEELGAAAKGMQHALNDPDCDSKAMPVEECAKKLEEVLRYLQVESGAFSERSL